MNHEVDFDEAGRRDAQAFATANFIVQLLKRVFFTAGPFVTLNLATPLALTDSLLLAFGIGFGIEWTLKRLLEGTGEE